MSSDADTRQDPAGRHPAADESGPGTRTRSGPGAGTVPGSPRVRLGPRSWLAALWRTASEFRTDDLTDWAAALTYYGVLSFFPALLVLLSLVGLAGRRPTDSLVANLREMAPPSARDVAVSAITNLQHGRGTAGVLAVLGLAGALWTVSAYVAAFMRASNVIYDVPEGRPIWKTLPIRIGLTAALAVLLAVTALGVVLTGGLASRVGLALGIRQEVVTFWDLAKWPVLLVIVSFVFALLYWASPNAKRGFRWLTPGSVLAVVLWLAASAGFAVYVADFGAYNQTYGSFAGIIVFLVWLWISNIAPLLGAEMNAELERGRAMAAGHSRDEEPYVELRDTRTLGLSTASGGDDPTGGGRS